MTTFLIICLINIHSHWLSMKNAYTNSNGLRSSKSVYNQGAFLHWAHKDTVVLCLLECVARRGESIWMREQVSRWVDSSSASIVWCLPQCVWSKWNMKVVNICYTISLLHISESYESYFARWLIIIYTSAHLHLHGRTFSVLPPRPPLLPHRTTHSLGGKLCDVCPFFSSRIDCISAADSL